MTATTAVCLGWLAVFGVLTLLELRRLSARIDEVSEDAAQALAELRCQVHTHSTLRRVDHEPAVERRDL